MAGKSTLINYTGCHPEHCDSGVCRVVLACPHKLIKQEAAYEAPMPTPSLCRGCGKCVAACPLKAVQLN